MAKKNPIVCYLNAYAEPEATLASDLPFVYQHALVIPAFNEQSSFLQRLALAFNEQPSPCLLIVVINAPEQTSDNKLATNKQLIKYIEQHLQPVWQQQHLELYQWFAQHHLLVVNRSQPGLYIPSQQGVGLARKIGADIACQLFQQQKLTNPWLFSSDADVSLPAHYFNACNLLASTHAAAVFDFIHLPQASRANSNNDEHQQISGHQKSNNCNNNQVAQLLYDIKLRYYVASLHWADSPFAYHTIGSLLAININHYCQVRGFPKRAGGEDFYCLNKLAKLGSVARLNTQIQVTARLSDRVPFGTGPALNNINQLTAPAADYHYYHPTGFNWLKQILNWLSNSLCKLIDQQGNWQPLLAEYCQQLSNIEHPASELLVISQQDSQSIQQVLEWLGINKLIQHTLKQPPTVEQWQSTITHWFDGFRTLKFIHLCRDHFLPALSLQQLVAHPTFKAISQWHDDEELNWEGDLIQNLTLIENKLHHIF